MTDAPAINNWQGPADSVPQEEKQHPPTPSSQDELIDPALATLVNAAVKRDQTRTAQTIRANSAATSMFVYDMMNDDGDCIGCGA